MNKKLIGLSGAAGAGKDYCASYVADKMGAQVIAFADPLYNLAAILFGTSVESLKIRSCKEVPLWRTITPNNLENAVDYLQGICDRLGIIEDVAFHMTEMINKDMAVYAQPVSFPVSWVMKISARKILETLGTELGRNRIDKNIWLNYAKYCVEDVKCSTIITDVRFPNEHELVKSSGGERWEIFAPNNPNAIKSTHVSANYVLPHDRVVINDYGDNFRLNLDVAIEESLNGSKTV